MRKSESAYSEGLGIAGKCWYWSLSSDAACVVTGKAYNYITWAIKLTLLLELLDL